MTVRDARKRLAKAGIEFGQGYRRPCASGWKTTYTITTPVGTELQMESSEIANLLRDLSNSHSA